LVRAASPEFRALDAVEYGRVEQVSPLIRRVIAENPSKFTYRGTGTYIVGHGDVVVIDPGPRLDSHRDALAVALRGERVRAILVTHCHADHSPLAAWLREHTGAPTLAFGPHPRPGPDDLLDDDDGDEDEDDGEDDEGEGAGVKIEEATDHDFEPTERVRDGEVVVDAAGLTMTAVHTPGHTSNHTCWTLEQESVLFTGDHVMGWSTTVVSPPDGDMAAYMTSLSRVAARGDATLWPTHGPARDDAREYVSALTAHRVAREAAVLDAVSAGHARIRDIVDLLYVDVRKELHKPARRSVWAHLVKLVDEGAIVVEDGERPHLGSRYRVI
jgi:glyoxylase-like metal-dependent hydrolase (beta-lactamase superfamily II)